MTLQEALNKLASIAVGGDVKNIIEVEAIPDSKQIFVPNDSMSVRKGDIFCIISGAKVLMKDYNGNTYYTIPCAVKRADTNNIEQFELPMKALWSTVQPYTKLAGMQAKKEGNRVTSKGSASETFIKDVKAFKDAMANLYKGQNGTNVAGDKLYFKAIQVETVQTIGINSSTHKPDANLDLREQKVCGFDWITEAEAGM